MDFDSRYPRISSGTRPWLRQIILDGWQDFLHPPVPLAYGNYACHKCSLVNKGRPMLTDHVLLQYTTADVLKCRQCGALVVRDAGTFRKRTRRGG